jgi:hypothetical protein
MKKLSFLIVLALVGAMVWTLPVLAAPKALSEAEMDSVTAAGQPEVLIAASFGATGGFSAVGGVTLLGTLQYDITAGTSAQQDLRALVVNNIVGENAVATALNIASSTGSTTGGSQSNVIVQSWGSIVDIGNSPTVASSAGGAGNNQGKCVFASCGNGGAGGSGSAGNRLSIYSDEILIGSSVFKNPFKDFEINLATSGQAQLAALILNNVAGINLAATAVNIVSGQLDVIPGAGGNANVFPVIASAISTQTNTIHQYRGTPFCASSATSNVRC